MSLIFISHSSQDNAAAETLADWLKAKKQHSLFLDFDPAMGIPSGHEWEKELYEQLRQCQAVIVLCSEYSMASAWCFAEAMFAKALGKHIFPVALDQSSPWPILSNLQVIDFTAGTEQGLERLWRAMLLKGLDPKSIFSWDGSRPPYPGLPAFQEQDAAIFFGREQEIHEVIAELNLSRQLADTRMLVLEGISGSGKSSLLRAGVIPRLKNDPENWLVINPFRPLSHPVSELSLVLKKALKDYAKENTPRPDFDQTLNTLAAQKSTEQLLNDAARSLREASENQNATVVLIIDQFEELLGAEQSQEMSYLIQLLSNSLLAEQCAFLVIATLRADFRSVLESHAQLGRIRFKSYSVMPMKIESYEEVITGPAQLSGIELEPGLVNRIISDIESKNALPLLAFTLRELWDRFGSDKKLTIEEYQDKLGGLHNSVAKVAESVLQAQSPSPEQLKLLRDTFISLARINEEGQFVRQPQLLSSLSELSRPVIEAFINKHLLVLRSDEKTSHSIVEVAHEALFQSWKRLKQWLQEEKGFLEWRYRLQTEIDDWQHVDQDKGALLSGATLDEALNWLDKKAQQIKEEERHFIQKSQRRRSGLRKLFSSIATATTLLILISAVIAFVQRHQAIDARNQASNQLANNYLLNAIDERDNRKDTLKASHYFMQAAEILVQSDADAFNSAYLGAMLLNGNFRLESISQDKPQHLSWFEFTDACPADALSTDYEIGEIQLSNNPMKMAHKQVRCAIYSADKTKVLSWGDDKYVRVWSAEGEALLKIKHTDKVRGAIFDKDQFRILSWSDNHNAILWDGINGHQLAMSMRHKEPIRGAQFSPDQGYIVTWDEQRTVRVWEKQKVPPVTQFYAAGEAINRFGTDADLPACRIKNATATLPVTGDSTQFKAFKPASHVNGCDYQASSKKLLTWTSQFVVTLWDTENETPLFQVSTDDRLEGAAIADSHDMILMWYSNGRVQIWSSLTGTQQTPALKLDGKINGVVLSRKQDKLLIWGSKGLLQLWRVKPTLGLIASLQHPGTVKAVFSTDERYIVSWSLQFLRIWDAQNGYAISPAMWHQDYIEDVKINTDTDQLFVRMNSGVREWNLPRLNIEGQHNPPLRQEVLTGTRLNLKSGELQVLDKKAWDEKIQVLQSNTH